MDATEVLNRILSNTCPSDVRDGVTTFTLETHCTIFHVRARGKRDIYTHDATKTSTEHGYDHTEYEILDMTMEEN